jgi:hypothetical protein
MQGSYFWLRTTRLYTKWLQMYQRKDGLSHLIQNLTSLSAFGPIFKNFEGLTLVDVIILLLVEDDLTLIHDGYNRTNEKIGSRITKN